jgi:hypothetical protein
MHADWQPQYLHRIGMRSHVVINKDFCRFLTLTHVIVTGRTIGTVPDSITDHSQCSLDGAFTETY